MPPIHHRLGPDCPLCALKLIEACPEIREWVLKIREQNPDSHIAWAFRGQEDQQKAFESGTSRLPWPRSRHNVVVDGRPRAEAFDLFMQDENGKGHWPTETFRSVSDWLKRQGAPIAWGGDWLKPDYPHFELKRLPAGIKPIKKAG